MASEQKQNSVTSFFRRLWTLMKVSFRTPDLWVYGAAVTNCYIYIRLDADMNLFVAAFALGFQACMCVIRIRQFFHDMKMRAFLEDILSSATIPTGTTQKGEPWKN